MTIPSDHEPMDKYEFRKATRFFESRQEVAEFLGVSRVMVHHYWHGNRNIPRHRAEKLREYEYGCEQDH